MNAYCHQQIVRRSKLARERVNKRWERVRADQRSLEKAVARDPLRQPLGLQRRVIIIEGDGVTVHEVVRLACDSQREWKRKLNRHGLTVSERRLV